MKVLLKSQEIKFLYACEISEACYFVQTSLVFALEVVVVTLQRMCFLKACSCLLQLGPRWIQQVSP